MASSAKILPATAREDGTYEFFPWGLTRQGYVLSREEGEHVNQLFLGCMACPGLLGILFYKMFPGDIFPVAFVAVLLVAGLSYWIGVKRFVAGKDLLQVKARDVVASKMNAMFSQRDLAVRSFGSLVFVAAAAGIGLTSSKPGDRTMGLIGVLLFGSCFLYLGYRAVVWRKPVD